MALTTRKPFNTETAGDEQCSQRPRAGLSRTRRDRIHQLKTSNNRFARLYDEYNELNRTIHRIETRVEPQTDEAEEELKRRRLQIKDEIMAMLDGDGRLIMDPHMPRWPRATARASAAETCASERRKLSASGVVTFTVTETGRPPPPRAHAEPPVRPARQRHHGLRALLAHEAEPAPERKIGRRADHAALARTASACRARPRRPWPEQGRRRRTGSREETTNHRSDFAPPRTDRPPSAMHCRTNLPSVFACHG